MKAREPVEQADLHAYADDLLPTERRGAVEGHLASHPEDAAAVAAWMHQNQALREAYDGALREPVPRRLAPAWLDRRLAVERLVRPSGLVMVAALALLAGAVAGAGAMLLAFPLLKAGPAQPAAAEDFLDQAVSAHRVFTPETTRPVELGAASAEDLQGWFSSRLDYPVAVPDLSAQGLGLVGGRLLSGPGGATALLLYKTATGERVSVVMSKVPGAPDSVFAVRRSGSLLTVWWVDEQTGFAVTGSLPQDAMTRVAGSVLQAVTRAPDRRSQPPRPSP